MDIDTTADPDRVVVGVDGTWNALGAVTWAATEARLRSGRAPRGGGGRAAAARAAAARAAATRSGQAAVARAPGHHSRPEPALRHLSRIIAARSREIIYVTGPGHGGAGLVANTWLEGTYSEVYPRISQDITGMQRLFTQFSFPGGIPSHVAPETPGSIHEGGELGYSLSHAYGAALDNPDLVVACVIGDGGAETGPLAASWLEQVPRPGR